MRVAPVMETTAQVSIVTLPDAGAVQVIVQVLTVIGVTRSFAEACVALLISAFGSVVVRVPPAPVKMKLKLFSPVAPFESVSEIVTTYAVLGV